MDIPIDITNVNLKTERLLLRAWEQEDLFDFFEYASVDGVGEMAGWPHHASIDISARILSSFIEEKVVFALVHIAANKVIGSLGIHKSSLNDDERYSHLRMKEIGYVLSKDYWGQGLMPEAVKAVIDYCFNIVDLEALSCGHFIENHQSKRVIEKCGFVLVKEGQFYSKQLDKTFDDMKYILCKESR